MPLLPARCTRCGHQFQPEGGIFVADGSMRNTFSNNSVRCPQCGGRALFVEGELNVVDGGIEMLSGPQWSWDLVEELRLSLKRAIDTNHDPTGALESVPEVQNAFRRATKGRGRRFKRRIAQAVLAALFADFGQAERNADTVLKGVLGLLRFVAEHGHLPGS